MNIKKFFTNKLIIRKLILIIVFVPLIISACVALGIANDLAFNRYDKNITAFFANNDDLVTAIVPNNITSMGKGAFADCSALTSLTIPFIGSIRYYSNNASTDTFGYIFGTVEANDADNFYAAAQNNTTYYLPKSLKTVVIRNTNSKIGHRCGDHKKS